MCFAASSALLGCLEGSASRAELRSLHLEHQVLVAGVVVRHPAVVVIPRHAIVASVEVSAPNVASHQATVVVSLTIAVAMQGSPPSRAGMQILTPMEMSKAHHPTPKLGTQWAHQEEHFAVRN